MELEAIVISVVGTTGGRPAQWAAVRVGWAGVIAFHVGLMFFGWGIRPWAVPALVVLVVASRAEARTAPASLRPGSPR